VSLYHGDFEKVGNQLIERTEGLKDFTLLANIPYGVQSAEKQHQSTKDLQQLYRRLGRFIQRISVP
jgi:Fe-S cluster assembly scaffold protein SufB